MSNNNDESVDFKVDLSKSPEEIQKEHKEKKESAKAEETKEVEAKAEETTEQVVEEKETSEEVEVVEEKKEEEEEEQPEQKITKEQLINEYLTDNFDMNVDKLKDVLSNTEEKQQLPEEVEKYLEYKKDTKRGLSDYVKLQQDIEAVSDDEILRNYMKESNPGLDDSDVSYLIDQKFGYDEDAEENEIKGKVLEKKKELFKAKEYFNNLKEKYKAPLESSAETVPEDYKKAYSFYNDYQEEQKKQADFTKRQRDVFQEKSSKLFNDEFKGFEFNLGGKKLMFKPKDKKAVYDTNSDLGNFINKHVDEDGLLKDASKYHTALSMAMNPDAYAKFFYEQGKADAVNDVVRDGKNINMDMRTNVDSSKPGAKFRVLNDDSAFSSGLKIKKR